MLYFISRALRVYILIGVVVGFCGSCDSEDTVPAPTIESFLPMTGFAGSTVTITGTNFLSTPTENTVKFNGVDAQVLTGTTNTLTVKVPAGTSSGPITVAHSGLLATSTIDFIVKDCSVNCGAIEKFILTNNIGAKFEPINFSKYTYDQTAETSRGIVFTTTKRIEITAIGGLFRKTGQYNMILRETFSGQQYSTTINAHDINEFAYVELTNGFVVEPGTPHLLFYCDSNHDSVYDVWLPGDNTESALPYMFDDIEVDWLYYSYENKCGGQGKGYEGYKNKRLLLRGIVDLKYDVVE